MSNLDRVVRVFVSLLCIYLGFIDPGFVGDEILALVIGFFGVFNILVVAIGICPVYFLAGINTLREKN